MFGFEESCRLETDSACRLIPLVPSSAYSPPFRFEATCSSKSWDLTKVPHFAAYFWSVYSSTLKTETTYYFESQNFSKMAHLATCIQT
jgi:hypothetical protein